MLARGPLRVASAVALALAAGLAEGAPRPKVVILGFDGADSRLVEQWVAKGALPNLAKLREDGAYSPLEPTNPPQTPVSWSSFATGTNPGKTEIFDFLKRDPKDYSPNFAMNSEGRRHVLFGERNGPVLGAFAGALVLVLALSIFLFTRVTWRTRILVGVLLGAAAGLAVGFVTRRYLPFEAPTAINHRKGQTMWELAAKAGLKVQVIRVPATFPAEKVEDGHMISGLGVPDMRGRVGTPSYYTSNPDFHPGDNEFSLELIRLPARRGRIETKLIGPSNKPFYDFVVDRKTAALTTRDRAEAARRMREELDDAGVPRRIDLPLVLDVSDTACAITVSGKHQILRVGDWSDWFTFDFPVNWLIDAAAPLRGIGRFKLLRLDPEIELYLSPVNFHPCCHPVAFAWPPSYSNQIYDRFGLYKTIGWPEDTWSLPSGVGDESLFLEDMYFTLDKDQQVLEGLLGDHKDDLYIQVFYFTDRIGHLFWRFLDPGHPLYDPLQAAKFEGEVLKAYQRMDAMIGKARALAGEDALFIVCSDHGFSSFRRGVNYNTWLVRNGFMTLKGQNAKTPLEERFDTRDLFASVDWSLTKAYALGLGSIYLNVVGREREGIVTPGPEYDKVREDIRRGLESLVDEKTGEKPVTKVWTREEMYTGFDPNLIPDLRAGSNLNYRVSWQTSLGGVPPELIEDNRKAWSGDHCSSDPDLVRGIFFCNRKIRAASPALVDIMPTVLKFLGVPIPAEVDGKPLL